MGKGLKRDIWVLAGCWATVLTASTLITSASPLAAVSIGINRSVAPFTIGMFLIGAASISAYSAQIFTALGRAKGLEHLLHERHGLTDSLLRKEGRTAGPGHQRPRHLRRRGRGLPRLRLRAYGDRLGRARLRRLRPDGPGRRLPRGQLPRRVAARRRPRGVEERLLPQLHDLPDDGWLSRAGGHGGAVGEERVVDVVPLGCISYLCV